MQGDYPPSTSDLLEGLRKEAAALCFRTHQDALNYTAHVREDVARRSMCDRLDVADRYINDEIGCYIRLHSRLSDNECDLLFVRIPTLPNGQPAKPDNIGCVEQAGLVDVDGDESGVFLGVTESVQGPKGIIPSFVWLLAPKMRDDFRRAFFADLSTVNIVIESGRIVAKRKTRAFGVDATARNGGSVPSLIQAGAQIVGDIEKDTGKRLRRFLGEFDLVNMLPGLGVRLDNVGVRVLIGELIHEQIEIKDVVLCTNERQARAVEEISHECLKSDEGPGIQASFGQSSKDVPQASFGNEAWEG